MNPPDDHTPPAVAAASAAMRGTPARIAAEAAPTEHPNSPEHATVLDYHQRTKHRPDRYAAGPETLDWDAQPDPFRRFDGAPVVPLPLSADRLATSASAMFAGTAQAQPMSLDTLGAFFELSFGLTAWKQHGPDRWALRAVPSSGNLHPTEAYLLAAGIEGLPDGLYHYAPKDHLLERRASLPPGTPPQAWIGLSSITWREAWKYGERAFRYCQLDAGHAVGAVRYAAAALGWPATVQPCAGATLAALLGLDREADFGAAEHEEPERLFCLSGAEQPPTPTAWQGQANRLDRHPMYRWPVIDAVARATREEPFTTTAGAMTPAGTGALVGAGTSVGAALAAIGAEAPTAAQLIRQRRSAQHFDRRATMPLATLLRLLQHVQPTGVPWDAWPFPPRTHLIVHAHRIDGLAAGAYLLARDPHALAALRATLLQGQAEWTEAAGGLITLAQHPGLAGTLRTLSCHQAIGSDACCAVSLLAAFDPAAYRTALQEAGLIGQALYLGAEAEGYRGTGIGCYFDDAVHTLLGLDGLAWQVLYHFTVGKPVVDPRITTEPPYAHLTADRSLRR